LLSDVTWGWFSEVLLREAIAFVYWAVSGRFLAAFVFKRSHAIGWIFGVGWVWSNEVAGIGLTELRN